MKKIVFSLIIVVLLFTMFSCANDKNQPVTEPKSTIETSPTTDPLPTHNPTTELDSTTEPDSTTDPDSTTEPGPTIDISYNPSPINLMYHEISDEIFSDEIGLFVSPTSFEMQIKYLVDNNIPTKFTSEVLATDGTFAVLTFDDGYKGLYTYAFPIIKKYNVKITIFLITDSIETEHSLSVDEIIEMSESGLVEFASHTCSHPYLSQLSNEELQIELKYSKDIIEAITGKPVNTIAYPYGDYNESIVKAIKDFGYDLAYTTLENIPASNLLEQPRYTVWRDTSLSKFATFISTPTPIYNQKS